MWKGKVQKVLVWAGSSFFPFLLFLEINWTIALGGLFLWPDFLLGRLTLYRTVYIISVVMVCGAILASFLWFAVIRYVIRNRKQE